VETNITKVAMDTHKKQHTVAYVNLGSGETEIFTVKNNHKDIKKMVKKLSKQLASELHFCYEAGVCGFTPALSR